MNTGAVVAVAAIGTGVLGVVLYEALKPHPVPVPTMPAYAGGQKQAVAAQPDNTGLYIGLATAGVEVVGTLLDNLL